MEFAKSLEARYNDRRRVIASMRPHAPDAAAYDAFVKEWMEDRVVPEYRVTSAKRAKRGSAYEVSVTVRNTGTGSTSL